jgi:hypothetical protein
VVCQGVARAFLAPRGSSRSYTRGGNFSSGKTHGFLRSSRPDGQESDRGIFSDETHFIFPAAKYPESYCVSLGHTRHEFRREGRAQVAANRSCSRCAPLADRISSRRQGSAVNSMTVRAKFRTLFPTRITPCRLARPALLPRTLPAVPSFLPGVRRWTFPEPESACAPRDVATAILSQTLGSQQGR